MKFAAIAASFAVCRVLLRSWALPILAGALLGGIHDATAGAVQAAAPKAAQLQAALARLAVPFLATSALDDPRVAFSARMPAGTVFVTRSGQLVYSLHGGDGNPRARRRVEAAMRLWPS